MRALLSLLLVILIPVANADWQLVPDRSTLTFVSTKKGNVAEVQRFESFSGAVSYKGVAEVTIDLSSINSGIDIRDERMKEHLFNVNVHPKAKIQLDVSSMTEALKKKGYARGTANAKVTIAGVTHEQTVTLIALTSQGGDIIVAPLEPVLLNANNFELSAGIEKLRQLAGLPSISSSVPVQFLFTFQKK